MNRRTCFFASLAVALLAAACSGASTSSGGSVLDGGSDTDGASGVLPDAGGLTPSGDGSAPSARCDKTKAFGKPAELPELADAGPSFYNVSSVWLDAAEASMIVTGYAGRSEAPTLYMLKRSSIVERFGAPMAIPGVDAPDRSEWSGAMSADGLSLYFDVARRQPYKATRATTDDVWTAGARIAPTLSTEFVSYVSLRPSATGVYFLHQPSSGGSSLVFLATGAAVEKYVLEVDGIGGYSVSKDERTLYYSTRDPKTTTGYKHYRATRSSLADTFGAPREVTLESVVISSNGGPRVAWVSEDECVLYAVVGKNDSVGDLPHDVVIRATR